MHYWDLVSTVSHAMDLLNVRYFMKPATAPEPGAVYQDANWKIYENPQAYPRAWVVHEAAVEPVRRSLLHALDAPGMDPHRGALVNKPLDVTLEPVSDAALENVSLRSYERTKWNSRCALRAADSWYLAKSTILAGRLR